MEVGFSNVFRLAVNTLVTMETYQLMLLVAGLGVVGLFSLLALWLWVRGGMIEDEHI